MSWDVGCPGHGKGPWDGNAGFIKRTLRRRILDGDLVLKDERAVYEEIVKLASELNVKASLKTKSGQVNHWNVMWLPTEDISRPAPGSREVDKVHHRELDFGVRNLFGFAVGYVEGTTTGLVLQQLWPPHMDCS